MVLNMATDFWHPKEKERSVEPRSLLQAPRRAITEQHSADAPVVTGARSKCRHYTSRARGLRFAVLEEAAT